ncbi:AraC family transcriptional regulator [Paenibacillus sp. 598K]|uniref:AraC family transcriptional regulator n=1 Tax=Paenibacillus sp. 598K TaxID=1117987 RepID=UPI000FF9FDB4|nr:AraC family transcriptional regulator [Paenibacillus sp. 598K]GBF76933.1 AraC family transcriptional regulator [Paenibacillus sp. 598K]
MTNPALREQTMFPDQTFPINVFFTRHIPPHWHDHIEWLYVKSGRVQVQLDGARYELGEGELAIVHSRQLHAAHSLAPDAEMVCIVFNEVLVRTGGLDSTEMDYFAPYFTNRMQLPQLLEQDNPFTSPVSRAFDALVAELKAKPPGFELFVKAELYRIFGLMFRYSRQHEEPGVARPHRDHPFTELLLHIRRHYHEPITVADAASRVNLSPNHFCKRFKQLTGTTLIDYVHLLRINEAHRLLQESDAPVASIAEQVGYTNLTYFGRMFKRLKRTTPSAVRRGSDG